MLQVVLKVTPETPPRSRTSRSPRVMSATASLFPSTWCSRGCSPAPRWRPPTSKSVSCFLIYKCRQLHVYFICDPALLLSWWWCRSPFRIWSQRRHCSSRRSSDHRELPSEAVQSLNLRVSSEALLVLTNEIGPTSWSGAKSDWKRTRYCWRFFVKVQRSRLVSYLFAANPLYSPQTLCQNAEKKPQNTSGSRNLMMPTHSSSMTDETMCDMLASKLV